MEASAPGRTPFPASRIPGLGLPLALGMGGHALFNLVDLWIVGGLGPGAIAAVTISGLVNSLAMVVMQGVGDGSVAVVARAVGAGDRARAAEGARQGILLALVLGVVLGVPPGIFAESLSAAFGASGPDLAPTADCLRVMSYGSVTMFVLMQAGAVLRAFGHGKAPAVLLVGANLLNVPFALALVKGWWGLPPLGAAGACAATVLARGVFAVVGLRLLAAPDVGLRWRGPGLLAEYVRPILSVGLPVAAQWFVRVAPVLAILGIAGRNGTETAAAYGIGSRLDQFALFACAGWGAAAATAVGQGLGARDPAGAARAAWTAAGLGVAWMVVAGTAFHLFAEPVVALVGHGKGAEGEVVRLGAGYLRVVVFGYPAVGLAIVLSMALAGGGSVFAALAVEAVVLLGLQVPLCLAAAPSDPGGPLGRVWWTVVATYGILAAAYAAVFLSGRWKSKAL